MSNIHSIRPAPTGFHHASQYASPAEVLGSPALSREEKRAILSGWASDMYAVASQPGLRRIPGLKRPIALAAILQALKALDDGDDPPPGGAVAMALPKRPQELDLRGDPAVAARRQALRSNIHRYIRLLGTELTELERSFIRRRLAEERQALAALEDAA